MLNVQLQASLTVLQANQTSLLPLQVPRLIILLFLFKYVMLPSPRRTALSSELKKSSKLVIKCRMWNKLTTSWTRLMSSINLRLKAATYKKSIKDFAISWRTELKKVEYGTKITHFYSSITCILLTLTQSSVQ